METSITIGEVRKIKETLEKEVEKLCQDFKIKTGLEIVTIDVTRYCDVGLLAKARVQRI